MRDAFELDWTGYSDSRGSRVPEGQYVVRVETAEIRESKASGNSYVQLVLEIVTGTSKGLTLVDRLMIMESTRWRWDDFFKALNISRAKGKMTIRLNDLTGKTLKVTVADDEYNGTTRSQIVGYDAAAAPTAAQPPTAMKAELSEPAASENPDPTPTHQSLNPWATAVQPVTSIETGVAAL